jgi:hypothetical protein
MWFPHRILTVSDCPRVDADDVAKLLLGKTSLHTVQSGPNLAYASGEGHRRNDLGGIDEPTQLRQQCFAGASSRAAVRGCAWPDDLASGPALRQAKPADRHR